MPHLCGILERDTGIRTGDLDMFIVFEQDDTVVVTTPEHEAETLRRYEFELDLGEVDRREVDDNDVRIRPRGLIVD